MIRAGFRWMRWLTHMAVNATISAQRQGRHVLIFVRVPSIAGFNHNPGAGFPNQPTNVFFMQGTSSPSVAPYNPAWKP
ncbi:hypothetical protein [Austwickia chelonae]|uniref:hypothetical protein n=1 Tax=Austwickia chelonae TaxID=100225 RepID=UPI0013C2BDDD|nr:hypothetical protein [Austwickia chelonae]